MGRGPGTTQRAILDALAAAEDRWWMTIPELAGNTSRSLRQVRTAVHALQARGLVVITKGHTGWKGRGDYGWWDTAKLSERDDPRTVTVQPGDPYPGSQYHLRADYPIALTLIRSGVPVSGLQVWLPDRKAARDERERQASEAVAARLAK